MPTRQEQREQRKRNGRKMKVSGKSVLRIAYILGERAKKLQEKK